jgi:hypothetical protein
MWRRWSKDVDGSIVPTVAFSSPAQLHVVGGVKEGMVVDEAGLCLFLFFKASGVVRVIA